MASRFAFSPRKSSATPATFGLIIACTVGFLLCWIPQLAAFLIPNLGLSLGSFKIWQPLTYPFVHYGIGGYFISFIFDMLWLFWFGGILERRFGQRPLITVFFAATLLHAAFLFIAGPIAGAEEALLLTAELPIAFIVVTVCGNQPRTEICFWGIPVKFAWIAIIKAAWVVLSLGTGNPLFGLIIGIPLLGAWFYGANKIPGLTFGVSPVETRKQKKKENREFDEFMSKVRSKEKDRAEQERLRKLFEGSIADDDTPESK
ncbi:MAG: rhomboid family intramembrane serine protease [Fimbriimonadaceae bacterium]|nr:rhomboid family intramembrane serine protease [Fimbriimonadaceae bacterium]